MPVSELSDITALCGTAAFSSVPEDRQVNPMKVAAVYNDENLRYIVEQSFVQRISLSMDFFDRKSLEEMARFVKDAGLSVRLSLPRISREERGRDGWMRRYYAWKSNIRGVNNGP